MGAPRAASPSLKPPMVGPFALGCIEAAPDLAGVEVEAVEMLRTLRGIVKKLEN